MQDYFVPAFFIALAILFLIMVYFAQRKQAKVDAVRFKHYRRYSMIQSAQRQEPKLEQGGGFQVLYERRTNPDQQTARDQQQAFAEGQARL